MSDAGYWIEEGVLSEHECEEIVRRFDSDGLSRSRAGARHLMSQPAVAALANDERLLAIARSGLGGQPTPFRATLFEKSPRSNWLVVWHQDTALPLATHVDSPEWGPWSTKAGVLYAHAPAWALARVLALRVHLDACAADSGPLRVLPGTHRCGVMNDEQVFRMARARPSVDCLVGRGGVLAMRPLVVHSSSKSASLQPRRVLHLEYAASLDLFGGIRLAVA
jgi:hypothetical protein